MENLFKKWFKRYKPLTQSEIAKALDSYSNNQALEASITLMLQCAFKAGYRRGKLAKIKAKKNWIY